MGGADSTAIVFLFAFLGRRLGPAIGFHGQGGKRAAPNPFRCAFSFDRDQQTALAVVINQRFGVFS
jgi:hypothetical protein